MGSMVATSGQGIPVDFTFGLDLLLDGPSGGSPSRLVTGKAEVALQRSEYRMSDSMRGANHGG